MAGEQTGTARARDRASWLHAIPSLLVGAGFFALWFWLLPGWLGFHVNTPHWRWMAGGPSVRGFAEALGCVWVFGQTGHGTPAPMAPPTRLGVVGFYRYVRIPMFVGFFLGWVGLWVVFGLANLVTVAVAAVVVLGAALFVRLYEDPTLRKRFGAEYEENCRNVPRWVPRIHPWTQ